MYCRQPSMANTVQTTNKTFKHTVPELCDPDPITCVIQPGEDGGCGLYIGNLESAKNAKIL